MLWSTVAVLSGFWVAAKLGARYPFTRKQSRAQLRREYHRQEKVQGFIKAASKRQAEQAYAKAAKKRT